MKDRERKFGVSSSQADPFMHLKHADKFVIPSQNNAVLSSHSNPISNQVLEELHKRHMVIQKNLSNANLEYVDAFHGEMGFGVHDDVRERLAFAELHGYNLTDTTTGRLKSKTTPRRLRQLVSKYLLWRWANQIQGFSPDHVLLTPYSSLLALECTLRALHRINPGKTSLLVPDGHYKSLVRHINASNYKYVPIRTNLADNCRLDPHTLRTAISEYREDIAGLLLTIPGNPLLATYRDEQLEALGQVLVEEDIWTIVDSAFELVVAPYKPLAAVVLSSGARLYHRVALITGTSKSHHATGPEKIGAVVTGNAKWREAITMELSHQFQRETSARAEIVLEHTPLEWVTMNADAMRQGQLAANAALKRIESKYGRNVFIEVGSNLEGPFKLLTVASDLMERAGISDSVQLQEYLLLSGLDTVPGIRMGFESSRGHVPVVRVNVHAPRIGTSISSKHRQQFYNSLHRCADSLLHGPRYAYLCESYCMRPWSIPKWNKEHTSTVKLGVVCEDPKDSRVALTPAAIRTLLVDPTHSVDILVETQAGVRAGFSDRDFIKAGAHIESRANVLSKAILLLIIKPCKALTHAELVSLRSDQYIVGFYGNCGRERMASNDISGTAISLDDGTCFSPGCLSPLSAMSLFAGELAFDHAVKLSTERFPGQLTTSTPCGHVLILGSGCAARAGAARALMMRMIVTVVCTSTISDKELGSHVNEILVPRKDLAVTHKIIKDIIIENCPQLIIAAAARRFADAPQLITLDHMLLLSEGEGTVIVDLAVSSGGNVCGAKLDAINRPVPRVLVANESNYPSRKPRQASSAFAAAMVRFLRERNLLHRV